ncbi:MAG: hypothetical protein JWL81_2011, partial [Verrucomicrobiales bacterium]|nr:hypothetical protein [Verrucomicrobiales bacterium]
MKSSIRFVLPLALALGVIGSYVVTHDTDVDWAVLSDTPSPSPAFKNSSENPAAALPVAVPPAMEPAASIAAAPQPAAPAATPLTPIRWQPADPQQARVSTKADGISSLNAAPIPPDFLEKIVDASGATARFSLPDGSSAVGTVELMKSDSQGLLSVQGKLSAPAAGFYFFQRQTVSGPAGTLVGHVRFNEVVRAWRVDPSGPDGAPMLNAVSIDQVLCVGNPLPVPDGTPGKSETADNSSPDAETSPSGDLADNHNQTPSDAGTAKADPGTPQYVPQTHPSNMSFPAAVNGVVPLQSLPGAAGVIYLDFDGEPGPFSGWSVNGDALPSGASTSQIKEVWQRVAEDFQAFTINVTTDRRVFDAATETSRKHVIISPTTDAAPGAGGVAYVGSWNNSGDTVCWVFILTGKSSAEAISHEVGHTLGLSHDGRNSPVEDYYGGHGSGDVGWAPIMGVGYYQNLSQWSKGEYTSANNTEDDLNIIVSNNNAVDYRADDTTAVYATADYLDILSTFAVSNEGIIETRTDVDAWRFQTTGGAVSLTVSTVNAGPNVDFLAEIYNSANVRIAFNNPDTTLNGTLSTTLPAGDYTLRVSGFGRGTPTGDGYTDYGSIGAYLISGSITNGVRHDRFTINENLPVATTVGTVSPRQVHGTNTLTYSITSGNTGGAFSINSATGQLSVANSAALNYETLST